MNPPLLALGAFVMMLALIIYPPGPYFVYEITVMEVKVPRQLVEKGYPASILVTYEYIYNRYGLDYGRFVNETFRPEGIYDYTKGRIIPPSDRIMLGDNLKLSIPKISLFLFSVFILALAATYTASGSGRTYYGEVSGIGGP